MSWHAAVTWTFRHEYTFFFLCVCLVYFHAVLTCRLPLLVGHWSGLVGVGEEREKRRVGRQEERDQKVMSKREKEKRRWKGKEKGTSGRTSGQK